MLRAAGEAAVLVHQEAEAPLLLQERLSAALRDEPLDLALARGDGFYVLGKQRAVMQYDGTNQAAAQPSIYLPPSLYSVYLDKGVTSKHR